MENIELEEYKILDSERSLAEEKIKNILREQSQAVFKLVVKYGKGPFNYNGEEVIAVLKNGTWFLRRKKQAKKG